MSFTQGHALIIGVAEYQHAGRLNVPMVVNDVHATEQVIVDPRYCGYPASQVELVTDENATCAGTLAALDRLAGRAGEEDTVFLFYCGHGALGSDGEYYLVSHDAQIKDGRVTPGSGVSQAELLEKLRLIQARRALLVFNTCFSGKISPTLGPGGPEIESRSLPEDMTSALLATGGGRIIITACREEQSSYVGSGPLTIFTQAMVDGLRGKGVANNAGYISAYSLYEHIFTAVSEAVKEQENDLQEPELTVIKGVGPFAVALYKGASDRGEFDEGEPVPETFAVRQVKPEIANRSYNVIVKVCDGAVAIGKGAKAVGKGGVLIEGNVGGDVVTGLQIVLGLQKKSLPHPEALARYLENMIVTHQSLRLQGIRAGDQPLSVLVEKVYVSLSVLDKGLGAPIKGENKAKQDDALHGETGILSVGSALGHYKRLVIIGDPGSGKTTLLAYLALTYARTLANSADLVKNRLGLDEADSLPVLLPLRDLGRHLQEKHPDQGKDGPVLLLDYLREYYAAQAIDLKEDFFSHYLENGQAAVLLDGMDEVANLDLRQRVARLIEKFVLRFGKARYVVTSRVVGYEGPARIAADFGLAKVRDFTPQEVRRFVQDWTRVVETKLAGEETDDILRLASEQAGRLIFAIESTPRVAELAINPLLLTVIALVHRYRAELPERRSELYEEAVEVLLWHWDRAKGLGDEQDLGSIKLDSGDRRSLLEPVAFWMHERQRREIELPDLRNLLLPRFVNMAGDQARAEKAIENFLHVINERSGLLIERGLGVYGFAHLTFQEYLVARYLAGREDHLAYTLNVISDAWWREVILLQAGYLSSQGPGRVSGLIRAIMNADLKTEPEPHHHLLLAAECLFDVGNARVEGDILGEVRARLKKHADVPLKKDNKPALLAKLAAMNALARIESGKFAAQFWKAPWGEPEWATILAGEFWMGSKTGNDNEKPVHKLFLPAYRIGRVPVTNAQYSIYVKDSGVKPPEHWRGGEVPPGLESHPVVNVTWYDALAYCRWLSGKINQPVTLPSEAEWEKAARGDRDQRDYPWGEKWIELQCNSYELRLDTTTPVGLFLNAASPYGVLDMSGNVWEWTRSLWGKDLDKPSFKYPYNREDGREALDAPDSVLRVLRGGGFHLGSTSLRCAYRYWYYPYLRYMYVGFRVVVSPSDSGI